MGYKNKLEPGVYQIKNIANNKIYIGSAFHLKARKSYHFSDIRKGKAVNNRFKAAIKHYGPESFVFEILEEVPENVFKNLSKIELSLELYKIEQFWVDKLNPDYNIMKKDVKRACFEELTPVYDTPTSKKILVFDENNNYIETCPSLRFAERKYKVSTLHIRKVADGKAFKPVKNLIFKWEKDSDIEINFNKRKGKFGSNNSNSHIIYQYDKEGVLVNKWTTAKEAVKSLGISGDTLRKVLSNKKHCSEKSEYLNQYLFKKEKKSNG